MPGEQTAALIPAESPVISCLPAGAVHPGAPAAAELVARVRAELPAMAGLPSREELLAAAWLMSLRSARTRRAYAGDLRVWLAWLAGRPRSRRGAISPWRHGRRPQRHRTSQLAERTSNLLAAPGTRAGQLPQLTAVLLAVASPLHSWQQPRRGRRRLCRQHRYAYGQVLFAPAGAPYLAEVAR